jgi:hypothetical protein
MLHSNAAPARLTRKAAPVGFTPNLAQTLRENADFVSDLCRFSEGIATEAAIRKKWRLEESEWTTLGENDELVRAIEEEKLQRIRNGTFTRERSAQLVTKAPDVLSTILLDEKNSPKHRIDSAKTLHDFATPESRFAQDQDRVVIKIDLTGDLKSKDRDILIIDKSIAPIRPDDVIDATPAPQELPPPRRRGRPPGSRNRPKVVDAEELPFDEGEGK